jgi:hypothetical protein
VIKAMHRKQTRIIGATAAVLTVVTAAVAVFAGAWEASPATAADNPVTIMGAGDIAAGSAGNAKLTGDLIRAQNPQWVFTTGDNAYVDGTLAEYNANYNPTWGSFKAITKPAPGNHDYHPSPTGYLAYWGQANVTTNNDPNQVWYAWDVGNNWRAYSLNTEVSSAAGSAQEAWLKADLAAHPNMHYIAYTHHPRYTSGTTHGPSTAICPLWNALQAAGSDLMVTGHNHQYERFGKMNCSGAASATGIRQFVAGSGGAGLYPVGAATASSEFRNDTNFGVLKLVLHENSYVWQFLTPNGGLGSVLDSGSQATNLTIAGPTPTPTTPPASTAKHYVSGEEGAYATTHNLGYNVHDTGMSAATVNALPAGDSAMVWTGTVGCPPTTPSAAFTAFVTAEATNPKVYGYYLADEPSDPAAACVAGIKAMADYIHTNAPGKKAFLVLKYPGTYAAYAPSKTNVDLIGLDPYPCRNDTVPKCNFGAINSEVDTAVAAGIPLSSVVPVFQAFGNTSWAAPTAAELQTILDTWKAKVPAPALDYTYSWGCQGGSLTTCLSGRTDWHPVMQAHNTSAPTPTPTPTPSTPPPTTPPPTTPTPTPTLSVLDRRIATSLGDVEQCCSSGSIYRNSTDLEMVYDGSTQQIVGMRFPNLNIPKGAIVKEAWLEFTAKDARSVATNLTIQIQASDNAPVFTTANGDVSSRPLSPEYRAWNVAPWTAGMHDKSPDMTPMLQSVVGRAGWSSGNAVVIKISGTTGSVRNAWSYDGSASQAPLLHVGW